jgi:hypothetical protein
MDGNRRRAVVEGKRRSTWWRPSAFVDRLAKVSPSLDELHRSTNFTVALRACLGSGPVVLGYPS